MERNHLKLNKILEAEKLGKLTGKRVDWDYVCISVIKYVYESSLTKK